ncbi:MAG: hypothetical protein AB7O59_19595 [Pirellulales bacterium]
MLITAIGCGASRLPDRQQVVPVQGSVVLNGKPLAGAVVTFLPQGTSNPRALRSNGRVGNDGSFSLPTYVTADGAPPGEYVVTIYWADPAKQPPPDEEGEETDLAPDLLKGRFAANTSLLRATVSDKPVAFAPLDLGASELAKSGVYHLREK